MNRTPGPWTVDNNVRDNRRDSSRINGPDGLEIAVAVQLHDRRTDKNAAFYESRANARLIAAAPDLLGALEWALDQIEDDLDPDHQAALAAAHKLVAHAKGIV